VKTLIRNGFGAAFLPLPTRLAMLAEANAALDAWGQ
jgi:hypothetical protein